MKYQVCQSNDSGDIMMKGEKDYNDDHRDEITDFVQLIPGFQECDEDIETWKGNRCRRLSGFQMLNDDEIVTSVQGESDPVDNEKDDDEDNNSESGKGPSNACAFSALETAMEWCEQQSECCPTQLLLLKRPCSEKTKVCNGLEIELAIPFVPNRDPPDTPQQ
ncbi:hypothetical protein TNCV_2362591 [Trichonephila clavipes]|nr:hypothetical protein TNCV_2362591 [Trichonephila clavipes]